MRKNLSDGRHILPQIIIRRSPDKSLALPIHVFHTRGVRQFEYKLQSIFLRNVVEENTKYMKIFYA